MGMHYPLRQETQESISAGQPRLVMSRVDQLTTDIFVAKTFMMNGLMFDNERLWLRGWELQKSARAELATLQ